MATQSSEEAFKEYVLALESNQSELEYFSNKIITINVIGVVAIIIAGGITYKKKQKKEIIEEEILKTDEEKILEILKDSGGVL